MNRCNVEAARVSIALKTDRSKSVQAMGRSRLINCGVTFDLAALSALCRHFCCSSSGSHHIRRPLPGTSCLALYNAHAPPHASVGGFARTWILDLSTAEVCPWFSPWVDCVFVLLRPKFGMCGSRYSRLPVHAAHLASPVHSLTSQCSNNLPHPQEPIPRQSHGDQPAYGERLVGIHARASRTTATVFKALLASVCKGVCRSVQL